MPLSYCSIACAIQPTVRPTTNSASALPSGRPSAVTAAPSAKSTFGYWPVSSFAANDGGGDAGAASGPRRGDRVQDGAGARVAVGIERVAEPRQILAAREPRRHDRHRLGRCRRSRRTAPRRAPRRRRAAARTRRRAPPRRPRTGSRRSRRRTRATKADAFSSWSASSTRMRRIRSAPASSRPQAAASRQCAGSTGGFAAGIGVDDRGDEFGQDRAPGPDDPGPPQVERREVLDGERRQPDLNALDQPLGAEFDAGLSAFARSKAHPRRGPSPPPIPGRDPAHGGGQGGDKRRPSPTVQRMIGDLFQRRGFGETQRVVTAIEEAAALDQADRRIDHRDQRSLARARRRG